MASKLLFACMCLIPYVAVYSVVAETPDASPKSNRVLSEFPIESWAEPITIRTVWDGKPGYFLLATSLGAIDLDSNTFSKLKDFDPKTVSIPGGEIRLVQPPDLKVGPFSLANFSPAAREDLSIFSAINGRPVFGFIGANYFRDSVIQLDFDARKVRILRPDNELHPEWGKPFTMNLEVFPPTVSLKVGDVERAFKIDTLNDCCVGLPTAAFDQQHEVSKQPIITTPVVYADHSVETREMRVKDFAIAGNNYHDLILREEPDYTLGLDFLERHLVTLDFVNRHVYFKAGKQVEHFSEDNMAGIRTERRGNQTLVQLVDAESPADKAGIRRGDILTALNGKPAGDYEMNAIHDLFRSSDGKEITIVFRRGKTEKTIKIKLRRAI